MSALLRSPMFNEFNMSKMSNVFNVSKMFKMFNVFNIFTLGLTFTFLCVLLLILTFQMVFTFTFRKVFVATHVFALRRSEANDDTRELSKGINKSNRLKIKGPISALKQKCRRFLIVRQFIIIAYLLIVFYVFSCLFTPVW